MPLFGLDEFARDIKSMQIALSDKEVNKAIKTGLAEVTDELRHRFGVYPRITGSFPQWAQLRPGTQDQREKLGYPRNKPLLRDGVLKRSYRISEDSSGHPGIYSDLPYAPYHELGTEPNSRGVSVPQRSTLGIAYEKRQARAFAKTLRYLERKMNLDNIMLGNREPIRMDGTISAKPTSVDNSG